MWIANICLTQSGLRGDGYAEKCTDLIRGTCFAGCRRMGENIENNRKKCILGDKRWIEPKKYGKISIRNKALKSGADGE